MPDRPCAGSHGLVALLDLPEAWATRYKVLASARLTATDPVIKHVTTVVTPSTWDCTGRVTFTDPDIAKSARPLLKVAADNGLRAGLTIPLTSSGAAWSYFTLTMRDHTSANELVHELPFALLLGQSILLATKRLLRSAQPPVFLSAREKEVLQWCAIGKSSWEIAAIIRISEATVNYHLANAARKLNVNGRMAACARAVASGMIAI